LGTPWKNEFGNGFKENEFFEKPWNGTTLTK
jgi:hypothetical protein